MKTFTIRGKGPSPRKVFVILCWIAVWQAGSMIMAQELLFPGPVSVLKALLATLPTTAFWLSAMNSFLRITGGFLAGFALGVALAAAARLSPFVRHALAPVVSLAKSVPVASFIILILVLLDSSSLSTFISFFVVFPIMYINTLQGLDSMDLRLLEMARVFHARLGKSIRFIWLPQAAPYLLSGCSVALGTCFKAGVAAEVIGVPSNTIGEQLYLSKIYLNTADLFAWTLAIIVISAVFEKLFLGAIRLAVSKLNKTG